MVRKKIITYISLRWSTVVHGSIVKEEGLSRCSLVATLKICSNKFLFIFKSIVQFDSIIWNIFWILPFNSIKRKIIRNEYLPNTILYEKIMRVSRPAMILFHSDVFEVYIVLKTLVLNLIVRFWRISVRTKPLVIV